MSVLSADAASLEEGCATGLARLPGIGPAGLTRLLTGRSPSEAWQRVLDGSERRPERNGVSRGPGPTGQLDLMPSASSRGDATWAAVARRTDVLADRARDRDAGIGVTWWGDGRYPRALLGDPQPAGVLFWRGDITALDRPAVAVVGTRRCSPDGRAVAFQLGRDMVSAGICVVSGLALGIDGAAHAGALAGCNGTRAPAGAQEDDRAGTTVGVAAGGVDVVYPHKHAGLWLEVVAAGAVVAETPPGAAATTWRFPSRNRLIAGLVRMVIVVESHGRGGALHTAEAALIRGVDLAAVPGSVRSPASDGTNALLRDGATPVRHAGDVLDGLGIFLTERPRPPVGAGAPSGRRGGAPSGREDGAVLDAVGWRPTSLGQVVARSGRSIAEVGAGLDRLVDAGLVESHGEWWSRAAP